MKQKTEINALLDSFKSSAESEDFTNRKEARKVIREHMRAQHWGDRARAEGDAHPSLQFTWLAVERMHPKIFNGYSFEPEVVPEANRQYLIAPDAPLRQLLAKVPGKPTETDAAKEAKVKTAIVQKLWEDCGGIDVIKEGDKGSLWYGDWFFLDGWDDGKPFLDNLHPDRVWIDPDAKTKQDSRFIGYKLDRTVEELKRNYPEHADEIRAAVNSDDKARDLPDGKVKLALECWFIRDETLKTITDTESATIESRPALEADGYEVDEAQVQQLPPFNVGDQLLHPGTMQPIIGEIAELYDVEVGYTMTRQRQEQKYPGGWRHVKRAGNVVVYDGPNTSASGELQIHWLPCYATPGEFGCAQGVPDQVQDINRMIDSLMGEAMEYVRNSKPGLIGKEGVLAEGGYDLITVAGGGPKVLRVPADEDTDIRSVLAPYVFPDLSATHQVMIDRLINILEQITGSYDLNGQNAAYDQVSGEAVEQLETAANARLSSHRAVVRNVIRDIVRNMLANYEKYSEGRMTVEVQAGDGYQELEVDPALFDVDGFERDFDIVIGSTDTLPPSGRARNEVVLGSINALMGLGPTMAPIILQVLELPEKAAIESAMTHHFQQMQQQPQADPVAIKQAENQADIVKRYNESLADTLEDFAKRRDVPPIVSLRAAMYLQEAANGKPMPPVSQLIAELTGLILPQPGAVPMGIPAPQPQGAYV